jgi:putative DNA primase/helicase
MNAREITHALGGKWHGSYGVARCVAHDDHSPSLKLRDGELGRLLVACYSGCEAKEILAELRRRGLIEGTAADIDPAEAEARSRRIQEEAEAGRRKREERARAIWRASGPAIGSAAEAYLRSRGITIAPPRSLRFHPALEHPGHGTAPAMVAAVQCAPDGRITGVHRTFLKPDGSGKAFGHDSKLSLGSISTGAVRLDALRPDQWLIVGEGIESTLSAMQATGWPGWAALSTAGLKSLVLPSTVRMVLIAADNDTNGAGGAAAKAVALRWIEEGRRVRIAMPPEAGTDFNDLLQRGDAARIESISNVAA